METGVPGESSHTLQSLVSVTGAADLLSGQGVHSYGATAQVTFTTRGPLTGERGRKTGTDAAGVTTAGPILRVPCNGVLVGHFQRLGSGPYQGEIKRQRTS